MQALADLLRLELAKSSSPALVLLLEGIDLLGGRKVYNLPEFLLKFGENRIAAVIATTF